MSISEKTSKTTEPQLEKLPLTPAESVQELSFLYNLEFLFHSGNRVLISLEKFSLIFGFFLMMFLVLYPMIHRFEFISAFLESLAGEHEGFRHTFFKKSEWAIELSKFTLLWTSIIGGALAVAHHKHITIDVVTKFLSPRAKAVFSFASAFVGLIFCFWLTCTSLNYVYQDMASDVKTTMMQIPVWWVKVIFPLGFTVFVYHYLVSMLEDLRGIITGNYEYLTKFENHTEEELARNTENGASEDTEPSNANKSEGGVS